MKVAVPWRRPSGLSPCCGGDPRRNSRARCCGGSSGPQDLGFVSQHSAPADAATTRRDSTRNAPGFIERGCRNPVRTNPPSRLNSGSSSASARDELGGDVGVGLLAARRGVGDFRGRVGGRQAVAPLAGGSEPVTDGGEIARTAAANDDAPSARAMSGAAASCDRMSVRGTAGVGHEDADRIEAARNRCRIGEG